jgi:hypothetical protein
MGPTPYTKTLVAWWRLGKEHGADELRVNTPEVIATHLDRKIISFRQTPPDDWRWWQVDDGLIVERLDITSRNAGPGTRIYYLLKRGLTVVENIYLPPPNDKWKWYLHLSDFDFRPDLDCWIMKDLFPHICVESDTRTYHLFDLPELAQALDIALITSAKSRELLKRVDATVNCIARGDFPFPEILQGQTACKAMGWM